MIMLIMIVMRLIQMMTKKSGPSITTCWSIIIIIMMMMPKIICVPQSQLLVLSAHLCPTTLKIGPHHTSQDNTLLFLLLFTHHKTTPHDCYFYSHITRHHLIIISIHTLYHIYYIQLWNCQYMFTFKNGFFQIPLHCLSEQTPQFLVWMELDQ